MTFLNGLSALTMMVNRGAPEIQVLPSVDQEDHEDHDTSPIQYTRFDRVEKKLGITIPQELREPLASYLMLIIVMDPVQNIADSQFNFSAEKAKLVGEAILKTLRALGYKDEDIENLALGADGAFQAVPGSIPQDTMKCMGDDMDRIRKMLAADIRVRHLEFSFNASDCVIAQAQKEQLKKQIEWKRDDVQLAYSFVFRQIREQGKELISELKDTLKNSDKISGPTPSVVTKITNALGMRDFIGFPRTDSEVAIVEYAVAFAKEETLKTIEAGKQRIIDYWDDPLFRSPQGKKRSISDVAPRIAELFWKQIKSLPESPSRIDYYELLETSDISEQPEFQDLEQELITIAIECDGKDPTDLRIRDNEKYALFPTEVFSSVCKMIEFEQHPEEIKEGVSLRNFFDICPSHGHDGHALLAFDEPYITDKQIEEILWGVCTAMPER